MLTIIEQFSHWRIPSERRLIILGKEDTIIPNSKTRLKEVAEWLPNDLALSIYYQICDLKGRTVFLQIQDQSLDSSEPLVILFMVEYISIRIVEVMGIPLPQAFLKGRPAKESANIGKYSLRCQQSIDINIADLYRLSTINPQTTFRKKRIKQKELTKLF